MLQQPHLEPRATVVGQLRPKTPASRGRKERGKMHGVPAGHARTWSAGSQKYNMGNVRIFLSRFCSCTCTVLVLGLRFLSCSFTSSLTSCHRCGSFGPRPKHVPAAAVGCLRKRHRDNVQWVRAIGGEEPRSHREMSWDGSSCGQGFRRAALVCRLPDVRRNGHRCSGTRG